MYSLCFYAILSHVNNPFILITNTLYFLAFPRYYIFTQNFPVFHLIYDQVSLLAPISYTISHGATIIRGQKHIKSPVLKHLTYTRDAIKPWYK